MKLNIFKKKKESGEQSIEIIDFERLTMSKTQKMISAISSFGKSSLAFVASSTPYRVLRANFKVMQNEYEVLSDAIKNKVTSAYNYNKNLLHSKYRNFRFDLSLLSDKFKQKTSDKKLKLYYKQLYDYKIATNSVRLNDDVMQMIYKEDISKLLINNPMYDAIINGK